MTFSLALGALILLVGLLVWVEFQLQRRPHAHLWRCEICGRYQRDTPIQGHIDSSAR